MRVTGWSLVCLGVLALGCRAPRQQGTGTETGAGGGTALAQCGGLDSPVGFENIAAGAYNEFFTARTRQSLKIKADVQVKNRVDEKGHVTGLTMIARDNSVNINCGCPGGCKSDHGNGCAIDYSPTDAHCSGDCVTETSCCFGCGFMAPR